MKVAVFDVPAEFGGVYTILQGIYHEACSCPAIDWTFIVGKAKMESKNSVTVKRFPWVKKSWLHRLFFDVFCAPSILRKLKPDLVVSFQNNGIRGAKVPQILYMHQAMMFGGHRYTIRENAIYWFYQNIQSKNAFRYMRANHTVVQTEWMKEAIIERAQVQPERVKVIAPDTGDYKPIRYADCPEARREFIYPANYMPYKRHDTILDAVERLSERGVSANYTVTFTDDIPGKENWTESQIGVVRITGRMPREEITELYSRSVLLFPSELESFGLPLLEARMAGCMIFAADTPFAREILENYPNAHFFKVGDSLMLSELMENCMNHKLEYVSDYPPFSFRYEKGWKPFVKEIERLARSTDL